MIWISLIFSLFFCVQDSWVQVESEDGHFSIQCPGVPKEHVITSYPTIGEINYHTFTFEQNDSLGNTTIFMVGYYDYPVDIGLEDSLELKNEMYQATIEEASLSIKGELVYAQDDFSYSRPGKLWRINFNDGEAYVKTKAFFYFNRYYSVQIVGKVGKTNAISERKFFNSFKLIL